MDLSSIDARKAIAAKWAAAHNLDPAIVAAVCEQESGWEPGAVRYEPAFYRHYIVALNRPSYLEGLDRATSWGLMQIMGQVAIEHGYEGSLPDLRDPDTGMDFGCRKLEQCFKVQPDNAEGALLIYNGGGNLQYGKQVLARVGKYQ